MAESTDPMGGTVAGSADLQGSMDRLDRAVTGLTTAIQGMSNGNGTTTSPAMASGAAAAGATFTSGSFIGAGGGSAPSFSGGSSGSGSSGGSGGTNPFSMFGSKGGGSLAQGLVNVGTSLVNGQFAAGTQQLNAQATINTYGYQQAGFWNTSSQSTITTAFGGGKGSNLSSNNLALNPTDARNGASVLSQISDQSNYTAGAGPVYGRGNAPFQLAATTGMANPGFGAANSAGIAGSLYSPSTSYNLMMMGVGTTPLQLGTGKANSVTGVESAIGNRFGFKGYNAKTGSFDSDNLAANLYNPLFEEQMMSAMGMNQTQYQAWAQQWAQTNTWSRDSGKSMDSLQNTISQYMNGSASQQKAALNSLKGTKGFNMSLLQSMTQSNALQTGAEAGGNKDFTAGLQAATAAVNQFTQALSGGLQQMAGTSGFAGGLGSLDAGGVVGAGSGSAGAAFGTAVSTINSGLNSLQKDISSLSGSNPGLAGYTGSASSGSGSGAGGGKPTGPVAKPGSLGSETGWIDAVLAGVKAPASAANIASFQNWIIHEHGTAANGGVWNYNNNPLETTMGAPGATNLPGNPDGVKIYPSAQTGLTATIQTLLNGSYPDILANLRAGTGLKSGAERGMTTWSGAGYSSAAQGGSFLVGERGPEIVSFANGGTANFTNAAQTKRLLSGTSAMPAQAPWTAATNAITKEIRQPASGGVSVVFQSGAITVHSSGGTAGYHTSGDVQPSAEQLVQAIETALNKSAVLRNIASGVQG